MTTTGRLANAVLHMPAMPLRVQLVGRLSEDLRAAIADATFAPADVAVLDASLHQVLNGWSLSVSRFFRVQDEVEAVLTRAMVGRALVDRVDVGSGHTCSPARWRRASSSQRAAS